MYDSSWEKESRSSHPNLWSPPIVTPMSRGAMSETETDLSREFPLQNTDSDRRAQRLPSVDEILFKIRHQEAFRPQNPQEVHFPPPSLPQNYQIQEQPNVTHWQRESLRTSNYQFDPRVRFEPQDEDVSTESYASHFQSETRSEASSSIIRSPQERIIPTTTTAKKRGRKKKSDTICSHCQLTQTPEWRRGPDGSRTLCNACGLFYLKLTKKFGFEDANMIFAYKKRHNEVQDRIVPTVHQRNRYWSESLEEK